MISESELAARHRKRLLPWHQKLVALVSGKLHDAAAHAQNAVTEVLRSTPDGRASAAVVRRSRSYQAALARLDELWAALGGPSVVSLQGLVQDCTAAAYRDSCDYWRDEIPPEYRVGGSMPTAAHETYVRGLLWYGQPIRAALEPHFKRAGHALASSVHAAGSQADPDSRSLKVWESRQRARLIRAGGLAISDANQRADLQAMRDMTDPVYLHEGPRHATEKIV